MVASQCLHNNEPQSDSCKHFKWLQKVRGRWSAQGQAKKLCPGQLCQQSGKRKPLNIDCTFGVCVRCCRDLQPRLRPCIACIVSEHRDGVVFPEHSGDGIVIRVLS